jgi:hypothetical protein
MNPRCGECLKTKNAHPVRLELNERRGLEPEGSKIYCGRIRCQVEIYTTSCGSVKRNFLINSFALSGYRRIRSDRFIKSALRCSSASCRARVSIRTLRRSFSQDRFGSSITLIRRFLGSSTGLLSVPPFVRARNRIALHSPKHRQSGYPLYRLR